MEIMEGSYKVVEYDKKLLKAMSEVVDKVADELDYKFEPFDMGIRSKVVSAISELRHISRRLDYIMDSTDLVTVQPDFNYDHWAEYEKYGMSPLQMLW